MATMLNLATKPFSLSKSLFVFGLRTIIIVILTWVDLMKMSMILHLNMFRKAIILVIALISLPLRMLNALQRESLLEDHLCEIQIELENLVWARKELADQLQTAIKERRILEMMLAEVEEESDRAAAKIELLEAELLDMKVENLQLKEIKDKGRWDFNVDKDKDNSHHAAGNYSTSYRLQTWKFGCKDSGIILHDMMMRKDEREGEVEKNPELLNFLKAGSTASRSANAFAPGMFSSNLDMNGVVNERREVALSQSLFSAIFSLLVGIIIWQAEDTCMPLVIALFTVVAMSLKSVIQYFFTIKNKPASDAVALLSFNWFILGTLTSPTLPRVAPMLAPFAASFLQRTMSWVGISSN